MTETEIPNIIEILRGVGWSGDQINDFQLGVEGRISVEEAVTRLQKNTEKHPKP